MNAVKTDKYEEGKSFHFVILILWVKQLVVDFDGGVLTCGGSVPIFLFITISEMTLGTIQLPLRLGQ